MFNKIKWIKKVFFLLVVILILVFLLSRGHVYEKNELEYGITFSKKQAQSLNLDWRQVYLATLEDLAIKKLRLPAYWSEVEPSFNEYYWDDLDWQVDQASQRGVEIILAVGGRLPRWPECHFPDWVESLGYTEKPANISDRAFINWSEELTKQKRHDEILNYTARVINRYKDKQNIIAWQVENEPFLAHFGDCPKLDKDFLDQEIALVRRLDSRPIVVTDSGELSIWVLAARRADIFGTTMYRDTYSKQLNRYIHYPITPGFFRLKKNITGFFAKPDKWIVIELQAEPWGPEPYQNLSKEERDRTMNLEKFKEIIEFSSKTGFKEFYFWGVEYWYWEKSVNNNNEMWEEAKKLF